MPSLPNSNCFTHLSIELVGADEPNCPTENIVKIVNLDVPPTLKLPKPQKWERRLPRRYIVAAMPSPMLLKLKVDIQTTDTGESHNLTALLDSGATGLFINMEFIHENQLMM